MGVVNRPYLATWSPLWLTLLLYASTTPTVLAVSDASIGRGVGLICVRLTVRSLAYRHYLCQVGRTTAGVLASPVSDRPYDCCGFGLTCARSAARLLVPSYLRPTSFLRWVGHVDGPIIRRSGDVAIRRAYEKTDNEILSHSRDLGRGGSTAVTAILVNGSKLWVANVGDSRAVLATRREVIQMTIDHEPNSERDRIETRGGFVLNMPDLLTNYIAHANLEVPQECNITLVVEESSPHH
ncbi:hypothetical protein BHM03_00012061 [Ensete ventricosum]|nr:hypothetical protein BHM03_00012061 [Ensete ventricosum]